MCGVVWEMVGGDGFDDSSAIHLKPTSTTFVHHEAQL